MAIWFALLIPVFVAALLHFRFRHRTVWWEYAVPILISTGLILAFKAGVDTVSVKDTEYWGGWATQAQWHSPWDEAVSCRHPEYCLRSSTCKDMNGRVYACLKNERCGYVHSYDVDTHAELSLLFDSNGVAVPIARETYAQILGRWNNQSSIDLNRSVYSMKSVEYFTNWDGTDAGFIPMTTVHEYENRVQASTEVRTFEEVDPKTYGLFEYPEIQGYQQLSILGPDVPKLNEARWNLDFWNAKLGAQKKLRMYVLIFQGQPKEAAFQQEAYWKGGNKNEFILVIGLTKSGTRVDWAHVISWTDAQELKDRVASSVAESGYFHLLPIVRNMVGDVATDYVHKDFKEYAYISVDPPLWATLVTYLVTLLVNLGLSLWIIRNAHKPTVVSEALLQSLS